MTRFAFALILTAVFIVGGLLALLRSRRTQLPPQDVLDRVKARNQKLDADERDEDT